MRFAAVTMPKTGPACSPAVEFVRRLMGIDRAPAPPVQAKPAEPPADLDQRVRLLGEW